MSKKPDALELDNQRKEVAIDVLKRLGYDIDNSTLFINGRAVGKFEGFDDYDLPRIKLFKKSKHVAPEKDNHKEKNLGVIDMKKVAVLFEKNEVNHEYAMIFTFGNTLRHRF